MRKIFIYLLLLFTITVFNVSASKAPKRLTEAQKMAAKIKYELEASTVLDFLRKCNADILKGRKDGKPIETIEYTLYSSRIKYWMKYRWFIADTGLSRKWLKSVDDLVLYMRKTQDYVETSKYNRNTKSPKFQQAVKYLDVAYERFVKLVKKPVKVSSKSVRKAKLKKALWQKAIRKKYKIKVKIQAVEF